MRFVAFTYRPVDGDWYSIALRTKDIKFVQATTHYKDGEDEPIHRSVIHLYDGSYYLVAENLVEVLRRIN